MEIEKDVFDKGVKASCEKDITSLSKIIGIEGDKQILLTYNNFSDSQKMALRKYNDDNYVLHHAVMNNDLPMVKWITRNDLADINKGRKLRSHNYQNWRLTPLNIAISDYYDKLVYDTKNSASSHEMIDVLKEKFIEKNGKEFDQQKTYNGDKLAIMTTFVGLKIYSKRSQDVNNNAASSIQKILRNHQSQKQYPQEPVRYIYFKSLAAVALGNGLYPAPKLGHEHKFQPPHA